MKYKLIVVLLMMSLITFAQNGKDSLYKSIYDSCQEQGYDDLFNLLPCLNGIYKNLNGEGYQIEDLNGNMYYGLGNTSQGLSQDETANSLARTLQTTPKILKEMCLWGTTDYIVQNGLEDNTEGVDYIHKVKEFFDNPDKSIKDILKDSNVSEFNLYIPEDSKLVLYAMDRALDNKVRIQRKSDPLEIYKDSIYSLADVLEEKLETIQKKYREDWEIRRAAEYALEDLENTRDFYRDAPSKINLDWDLEERPINKKNRYSDYKSKSFVAMLIEENKIILWPSNSLSYKDGSMGCEPVTSYDPSGRKITLFSSLPSMEQWTQLFNNNSKEVGFGGWDGLTKIEYRSINTPLPPVLKGTKPSCWRINSKLSDNFIVLPFGRFWSAYPSEGYDVKWMTEDKPSVITKRIPLTTADNAKSIGVITTSYDQLLEMYKKSLNHLMCRVDALTERKR